MIFQRLFIDFYIDVSFNVHVFSEPTAENGPINPKNISKNEKKKNEYPGADRGAIWRRKRSKDACSSIWDSFLVDFVRTFYRFRLIVDIAFQDLDAILT